MIKADVTSDDDAEFPYVGVPLVPSIIEKLTLDIFGGRIAKRDEIMVATLKRHLELGGLRSEAALVSQTKKALRDLCRKGDATAISYGRYKIAGDDRVVGTQPDEPTVSDAGVEAESVSLAVER